VRTFDDPAQAVRVAVGERFAVRLETNPSTGYLWHAEADDRYLELIEQSFELGSGAVGAAGYEVCRFRALVSGETQINLQYRRPWEQEPIQTQQFRVEISAGQPPDPDLHEPERMA
jgi:predicted secreted protein